MYKPRRVDEAHSSTSRSFIGESVSHKLRFIDRSGTTNVSCRDGVKCSRPTSLRIVKPRVNTSLEISTRSSVYLSNVDSG